MQIRQRLERLEQQGTTEDSVLVIIGEPDDRQQAILDAGTAKVQVFLPDNHRDDHGRDTRQAG